ncbi:hypothetical protein P280DRAFT_473559 [Massarina eburnea CBS 473.64]|uniref:KOW domain-containing protein n=1 Tax=Massarina eburnea CBS 473.64 TaxID=1395130 RepID=A0A6A6RMY7_9PLEO|nr:hypothetical protein P280DRAFT_473559 [Massarina eburnea CBS 473.64]
MSPASSAAPLRTARALAKQKDIHHVKSAIRWHERQRKARQAVAADAFQSKQARLQRIAWQVSNVKKPIRRALGQAREDWRLGPLRPNRAVGSNSNVYGALTQEEMRRPAVPARVQQNRNEYLAKKGREAEYPLVVDDQKYFPIVRDDRVVVIRGREQGKVGVVQDVIEASHEVVVKDINKHYADSSLWNPPDGESIEPQRNTEAAIPCDDVRLVIPYRITTASGRDIFEDVVVDSIVMERHTTGVDPFTRIDYGNEEFPVEHRYDPVTELPIFKRYVAGTRSLIQWPWEKKNNKLGQLKEAEKKITYGEHMRIRDRIRHPIKAVKFLREEQVRKRQEAAAASKALLEREGKEIKAIQSEFKAPDTEFRAKSRPFKKSKGYDDDTGPNRADPQAQASRTFYPTLMYPPFPNEIADELAPHIREARWKAKKDKRMSITQDVIERERTEREAHKNEEKARKLETMKTPLQLRWEVQREQQLKEKKEVDMDMLLAALGKHITEKGASKKTKGVNKVQEVDVE